MATSKQQKEPPVTRKTDQPGNGSAFQELPDEVFFSPSRPREEPGFSPVTIAIYIVIGLLLVAGNRRVSRRLPEHASLDGSHTGFKTKHQYPDDLQGDSRKWLDIDLSDDAESFRGLFQIPSERKDPAEIPADRGKLQNRERFGHPVEAPAGIPPLRTPVPGRNR